MSLKRFLRDDFREPVHIRPFAAELGVISDACGSARFAFGNTSVIVAVYGPGQPKYARLEKFDKASVEVIFTMGNMQQEQRAIREAEGAKLLQLCVEGSVILADYPRRLIEVRADVERDDGGCDAVALNACVLALLDAGVNMHVTPAAISIIRTNSDNQVQFMIDPLRSEETDAQSSFLLSHGQDDTLLQSECRGCFTIEELQSALSLSVKGMHQLESNLEGLSIKDLKLKLNYRGIDTTVNSSDEENQRFTLLSRLQECLHRPLTGIEKNRRKIGFYHAVCANDIDLVVRYLDNDINIEEILQNKLNALCTAITLHHADLVIALLRRGAHVEGNGTDKKLLGLHLACDNYHKFIQRRDSQSRIILELLKYDVNINKTDVSNRTPADYLSEEAHLLRDLRLQWRNERQQDRWNLIAFTQQLITQKKTNNEFSPAMRIPVLSNADLLRCIVMCI